MHQKLWLFDIIVILSIISGIRCLRNVTLELIPAVVQRGNEVILKCDYILDEPHLYSVKWYRGKHEFYRFSPRESPSTKVFNISGIHVDIERSNESQITIRDVDFGLNGNFCCEVTADAPTFSTESATKKLTIVSLPSQGPTIVAERRRNRSGEDILKANCSIHQSVPPIQFSFTVNNSPIQSMSELNLTYRNNSQWQWCEISIPLTSSHYGNSPINLRCIAQIPQIYNSTAEISVNTWEPIPERVTSDVTNGIDKRLVSPIYFFMIFYNLLR